MANPHRRGDQLSDIIDDIDRLVDEQLEAGEQPRGYDFGDPAYPRCPHCGRHWHGLPITARVARMYALGEYDGTYSAATDDSPILCEGSEFIGPIRAEPAPTGMPYWLSDLWEATYRSIAEAFGLVPGLTVHPWTFLDDGGGSYQLMTNDSQLRWWRLGHTPDRFEVTTRLNDPRPGSELQIGEAPPLRIADYRWTDEHLDVLAAGAPAAGGTWEPLTAPGITEHPELPR
jgi:hypothetical protein